LFTTAPTATLVAHELGHGAFALEHSFEGNASLPKNTSTCLMDYNHGTGLFKGKYWDYVHEPTTIIGALQDSDDDDMGDKEAQAIYLILGRIKKAIMSNSTAEFSKDMFRSYRTRGIYIGGIHYSRIDLGVDGGTANTISIRPKNNIQKLQQVHYDSDCQCQLSKSYLVIDDKIDIGVPADRIDVLKAFLEGTIDGKNLLIFCNGYRPNTPNPIENPKMPDEVNLTDVNGYWKGIDAMFINRIGTRNVIYADGHQTVATSNHTSELKFMTNYAEWGCASSLPFAIFAPTLSLDPTNCMRYYHNSNAFKLHTTPNNDGFQTRRNSGKLAGMDLITKINNGTVKFDPAKDTIDIVSHSMGHAYALGIIDALSTSSTKFKFGRFYCLAPENGCSTNAKFNFNLFEEVWQYGSNEKLDLVWEQDGIAPQCPIPGIELTNLGSKTKYGRIFIPDKVNPKRYLESHMIVYYFWLFSEIKPNDPRGGYVRPR
jgi:hypothetical protein